MAIKRYVAIADNTITNIYNEALASRRTKANTGLADSLEVFKIYGQVTTGSVEQARILIKFPINETTLADDVRTIKQDRDAGLIPASGSVTFIMKISNVRHPETSPTSFKLVAHPLKRSWDEGLGMDLDEYTDIGQSSWLSASSTTAWATAGASNTTSDVDTTSTYLMEQEFDTGLEDFEVDISKYVEDVLKGDINSGNNFGHILQLSSSYLADSNSYYTKKFSARGSEYFFKRPMIEARWDSSTKDDRNNFYYSSSLCSSADNLNTLYLYNNIGGRLKNLPSPVGTGSVYVQFYLSSGSAPSGSALTLVADGTHVTSDNPTFVTGGYVSTGIYSCSVGVTGTAETLHDVWYRKTKASTVLTFGSGIPSNGTLGITFGALGAYTLTFDNTAGSTDSDVGTKASAVLTFGSGVPSNGTLAITFGSVGTYTLTFDNTAGSSDSTVGSDAAATIDSSAEIDSAGNAQKVLLLLRDGITGDLIKNAYDFAYDGSSSGAETVTITSKEIGSTHNITVTESLSNISSTVTAGDKAATIDPSVEIDSAGNAQRTLLLLRDGVIGNEIKNAYDFAYDGTSTGAETVTITSKQHGSSHDITVTESLSNISSSVTAAAHTTYHTGTIYPETRSLEGTTRTNDYYVSITNLKKVYDSEETARFRIYSRLKGWSPTIYTRAVSEPQLYIPTSGSYEIFRIIDNYKVVEHATGSLKYTELSFDGSGSYFDFDMSLLEPGYSYGIKLAYYDDFISDYKPINKVFKFRVEKHET